jgi:hypothetical protein
MSYALGMTEAPIGISERRDDTPVGCRASGNGVVIPWTGSVQRAHLSLRTEPRLKHVEPYSDFHLHRRWLAMSVPPPLWGRIQVGGNLWVLPPSLPSPASGE